MPTRLIREGINDSEAVNRLSMRAEVFYRRLLNLVDDFGRYEAKSVVLRGKLFHLQSDRWSLSDVESALSECASTMTDEGIPLVRLYENKGRTYLEVAKFRQRIRAEKSRWPDPPWHLPGRCQASARLGGGEGEGGFSESEADAKSKSKSQAAGVVDSRCDDEPPAGPLNERAETIRDLLRQYVEHFGLDWEAPDDGIVSAVDTAIRGASVLALDEILISLLKRKRKPKTWRFFPSVVAAEFNARSKNAAWRQQETTGTNAA